MKNLKKVLLRVPKDASNSILSFPFLHLLKTELGDETQFNVVIDEEAEDLYKLLPFEVNTYILPKEKNNFRGVHHFSCNLHDVFNVDYFFDFENTVKSRLMGWSFKCRERFGINTGVSKYLLNRGLTLETPYSTIEDLSFTYLESLTGKKYDEYKIRGDKVTLTDEDLYPEAFEEEGAEVFHLSERDERIKEIEKKLGKGPYVLCLINVDDVKVFDKDLWSEILKTFEDVNFKICITGSHFTKTEKDMLVQFFNSLSDVNTYNVFFCRSFQEVSTQIKESKGVITNEWIAGSISSYFGVDSFVLPPKKIITFPRIHHFITTPRIVMLNEGTPKTVVNSDQETEISGFTELADFIHKSWSL